MDKLIQKIRGICNKSNPLTDLKSFYNRRVLLKLLSKHPLKLVYIEKYKRLIDFRFFGYTITYNPGIESIGVTRGDVVYISYYDYGDRDVVNKITDILNKKYHEHQQKLITTKITNP